MPATAGLRRKASPAPPRGIPLPPEQQRRLTRQSQPHDQAEEESSRDGGSESGNILENRIIQKVMDSLQAALAPLSPLQSATDCRS